MDAVKRGDLVTVSLPGDLGKPRPAVVVQSDVVPAEFRTVTLLPLTGSIAPAPDFRITVEPSRTNGLREVSQIMVDKVVTHARGKVGEVFGALDDRTMLRVNRALALWLGLAD